MKRLHCSILSSAVAALFCAAAPAVAQQSYPNKPIRIVVPFTPGGSNDVLARAVSNKLPDLLGVPVIVENKPGAGGNIGAEQVAKADPDGYTLLVAANTLVTVNQHLYSKLRYNPETDLVPVAMLGSVPMILTVNSTHADTKDLKRIPDLVSFLKKHPNKLAYASSGAGVIHHLSAEMFNAMAGTSMLHVPYKGTAPAVADLLAGEVQVYFAPANSILPHMESGRVRALGVTRATRSALLPDIPAIPEAGYKDYESLAYAVLMAPAGTPASIVEKLNAAVDKVLGDPAVKATLAEQYIETDPQSLDRLKKLLQDDSKRWGEVVKAADIRIE